MVCGVSPLIDGTEGSMKCSGRKDVRVLVVVAMLVLGAMGSFASAASAMPLKDQVATLTKRVVKIEGRVTKVEKVARGAMGTALNAQTQAGYANGFISQCLSAVPVNVGANGVITLDTNGPGTQDAWMVVADDACVSSSTSKAAGGKAHVLRDPFKSR